MKKSSCFKVGLIIAAMLGAGCASTPTKGDKMLAQGETAQDLAKKWNYGNELLVDGEKLRKKGQKMIEEGKINLEEGDEMVSEGKRMMAQSEKAFSEKFPHDKSLK